MNTARKAQTLSRFACDDHLLVTLCIADDQLAAHERLDQTCRCVQAYMQSRNQVLCVLLGVVQSIGKDCKHFHVANAHNCDSLRDLFNSQ